MTSASSGSMSVPSSVPSRPTALDAAVGVDDERQRVAAAGQLEPHVLDRDLHVRVGDGDEAVVGALLAQRAVQQRQHGAGGVLVGGGGAQRVAGERGDRRGVGALALDVADQRRPAAVAGLVEVVEVAAELDVLAGRAEAHGGGQAGDVGQRAGAQAALQRARDRALALVEARVGDRHRGEARRAGRGSPRRARLYSRPGRVDDVDRPELAAAVGQLRRSGARARAAPAPSCCGRGGRQRRAGAGSAAITATVARSAPRIAARRVGGELEDLLRRSSRS